MAVKIRLRRMGQKKAISPNCFTMRLTSLISTPAPLAILCFLDGFRLTLIEKAEAEIDEEKAKQMAQKLKKNQFDFECLERQTELPFPAAFAHHLHHLLHLTELLYHPVDLADVHTCASGWSSSIQTEWRPVSLEWVMC